jgi:hypothetical protein
MDDRSWIGLPPAMARPENEPEVVVEQSRYQRLDPTPGNSLDYLQSIYRDPAKAEGVRMRAAIAALPFEHAKLSASLTNPNIGFAERMERAIDRTNRAIDARTADPGEGSGS